MMTQDEIQKFYALLLSELGVPPDYSKPIEINIDDPKISSTLTRLLMHSSGHVQFVSESSLENSPTLEPCGDQNQFV